MINLIIYLFYFNIFNLRFRRHFLSLLILIHIISGNNAIYKIIYSLSLILINQLGQRIHLRGIPSFSININLQYSGFQKGFSIFSILLNLPHKLIDLVLFNLLVLNSVSIYKYLIDFEFSVNFLFFIFSRHKLVIIRLVLSDNRFNNGISGGTVIKFVHSG